MTTAALGHLVAGGTMHAPTAAAAFAGSATVAWLLSARRVTPGQLLGLLVLCQIATHLAASFDGGMVMGPSMIAAHLVATGASLVALSHGEAFVWRLAEHLGLRLSPLLRGSAVMPPVARQRVRPVVPSARREVLLAHSRWLRGPPVSPA